MDNFEVPLWRSRYGAGGFPEEINVKTRFGPFSDDWGYRSVFRHVESGETLCLVCLSVHPGIFSSSCK
jgi:hypothetical protein